MPEEEKQQHVITLNKPNQLTQSTQSSSEEFKHLIQGLMTVAMAKPRNEQECERKILLLCQDLDFAEKALYDYPKGEGSRVIGLSIYAVNEIKRIWGRLYDGWELLDPVMGTVREQQKRQDGSVELVTLEIPFTNARALCVDLESCNLTYRSFRIPHRYKVGTGANAVMKDIYDERDIYEYCANLSQRRKRSAIEEQIPRQIRTAAIKQIQETKLNADKRPIDVRVSIMLEQFAKAKIPEAAILNYLGCSRGAITAQQISDLKSIYVALGDGEAKISDFFDVTAKAKEAPKGRRTKAGKPVSDVEGADTVDVESKPEPKADSTPAAESKPEAKAEKPPKEKKAPEKPPEPPPEAESEADQGEEEEEESEGLDLGDEPADPDGGLSWGFES